MMFIVIILLKQQPGRRHRTTVWAMWRHGHAFPCHAHWQPIQLHGTLVMVQGLIRTDEPLISPYSIKPFLHSKDGEVQHIDYTELMPAQQQEEGDAGYHHKSVCLIISQRGPEARSFAQSLVTVCLNACISPIFESWTDTQILWTKMQAIRRIYNIAWLVSRM